MGGDDYVFVASTLGGNPVSTAAAGAALSVFAMDGVYEELHRLGDYLRSGLRRTLAERQINDQVIGDGPLAQVVFSNAPVSDYRSARQGDVDKSRRLMLGLFSRGVFLNPMGTKLYLSLAHDDAVCDQFLERFEDALADLG